MTKRPWTTVEVTQLRAMYPTMTIHEISAKLNRSFCSVANMAARFGICKSSESKSALISKARIRQSRNSRSMGQALREAGELLRKGDRDGALRVIDDALFDLHGGEA